MTGLDALRLSPEAKLYYLSRQPPDASLTGLRNGCFVAARYERVQAALDEPAELWAQAGS